ncbi:MAG TPA: phosphomannomutase/phosphoglucomutase [Candidatus Babeliales bacterium]|nr:phosphomannomutase/phosphoglucomutase [Candidatus Babeliales bacterium]
MMKEIIFREYDIRGLVDNELIIDDVYDLGCAIAFYLVQLNKKIKTVAVGMDVRQHSPIIKDNLCRALIESGLDVVFVGVCTTPMIYFATNTMQIDAAIMVTASHNPKEYNGMKICLGTHALWGKDIKEIGRLYYAKKHCSTIAHGVYSEHALKQDYIAWHREKFNHLKGSDLKAVIDCGNGSAGIVLPTIIAMMEWKNIQLLYSDVDGTFPNHEADPTHIKNMRDVQDCLRTTDAVVGIGFDGDADRMGAMTKEGELVSGDKLIALFAQPMVKQYPSMVVVYNVVCSAGLTELLESWGARVVITPVGCSIIKETMEQQNAMLGGETSGHFFFRDRHFGYDDGIYAMFRLIELLIQTKKDLSQLLAIFPAKVTSPEFRIACDEENKHAIVHEIKNLFYQQKNVKIIAIDGVRVITDYGWGIIRASNTQPVLSIRFEANTHEDLQHVKEDFVTVLSHYFDDEYLREQFQMNNEVNNEK